MVKVDNDIARLSDEIERYLMHHQDAADTIEGITRWWIPQQRFIDSLEKVNAALNRLIRRGLVVKRKNSDGTIVYKYLVPNETIPK